MTFCTIQENFMPNLPYVRPFDIELLRLHYLHHYNEWQMDIKWPLVMRSGWIISRILFSMWCCQSIAAAKQRDGWHIFVKVVFNPFQENNPFQETNQCVSYPYYKHVHWIRLMANDLRVQLRTANMCEYDIDMYQN